MEFYELIIPEKSKYVAYNQYENDMKHFESVSESPQSNQIGGFYYCILIDTITDYQFKT